MMILIIKLLKFGDFPNICTYLAIAMFFAERSNERVQAQLMDRGIKNLN